MPLLSTSAKKGFVITTLNEIGLRGISGVIVTSMIIENNRLWLIITYGFYLVTKLKLLRVLLTYQTLKYSRLKYVKRITSKLS
ncbi:hypothetical protein GIB67_020415 [Kingdonia uniflora]|uniref:Uncharacterized protein n=1 Tax=Kingdonia uniflora TaxID=39325 RepID=A0A7J7NUV8_9MAGN|nr:hypothetical protein GIB67_037476 [Kingdonia uniflora]KAF6167725.1 hypothetical protein GIB67_017220 [Kingdonia uniflora]KAF6170995.1 hypothetical protein GIB67_020415 [Kingdonia uniflora]